VYVESAPGSGKTTVAAERFGILRHERHRDDPRGVLAVSFARSAAAVLQDRTEQRWGTRTTESPNRVTTMDGLHRMVVDFLLNTGLVQWPGSPSRLTVIDSWARQRGAVQVYPTGRPDQRWELALTGHRLRIEYRRPDTICFGMPYDRRADFTDALLAGVCTHDEIRQLVGLGLGRPDMRKEIDSFLARSFVALIVDEAFDLNGLDALLVRRAIEQGIGVTLLGDPWQALYEWRGARPDRVHELLTDFPFAVYPMLESFRFKSLETKRVARRLRARQPVRLRASDFDADVVLGSVWSHLLSAGTDVIPLSFGHLDCQTDAALTLALDEVTRARLGERAIGLSEALRCLRRDDEGPDLQRVFAMLRDSSIPTSAVLEELRVTTKIGGLRRPSLPAARVTSRLERVDCLRHWITADVHQIPGLSFHQAKGREWSRVDVALNGDALAVLGAGLDATLEEHRKLYVALTRGRERIRRRSI
jgi:DNA helicase-2/ATP-dependent DNA helicase PcrA